MFLMTILSMLVIKWQKKFPETRNFSLDYLRKKNSNSMFRTTVEDIISDLEVSKSVGRYKIPTKLLKIQGPFISHFLAQPAHQSFHQGLFPDKLKIAKFFSLFKKASLSCHQISN